MQTCRPSVLLVGRVTFTSSRAAVAARHTQLDAVRTVAAALERASSAGVLAHDRHLRSHVPASFRSGTSTN